ncbi:malate dehydrogenase [Candidatus Bathyarchaeota archaeon]|nr:malate dehydrogenase [Candidatus Bathyarchaeota archaeon]
MCKITVIGAGNLGSCIAYEVANRGLAEEIVLIDVVRDLAEGNAADIGQAIAFRNNTDVYAGGYGDAEGSDIIVVAAGKPRGPGMKSRLELLEVNRNIIKDIAHNLKSVSEEPIIITLTNPVDVMNYFMWKCSGLPRGRVLGSAGMLDSARFRHILSRRYSVPVLDVEAYIIGEHGDNQVPVFSKVKIGDRKITFSVEDKNEIAEDLKKAASTVISKKGATVYAPANNTANMIEKILNDRRELCICSAILEGEYGLRDLSIGVPVIVGRKGIEEILKWDLSEDEERMLYLGAENIRKAIESIL